MTTSVNTAKVRDRRQLQFNSIDEVLSEIDRIVSADQAGTLRHLGNWTPGQIMGHVAAWTNYSYDGYPLKPPPWFIHSFEAKRKQFGVLEQEPHADWLAGDLAQVRVCRP